MPRQLKIRGFFQPTVVSDSDDDISGHDGDPIQSTSSQHTAPGRASQSQGTVAAEHAEEGVLLRRRTEPSGPAPTLEGLDAWRQLGYHAQQDGRLRRDTQSSLWQLAWGKSQVLADIPINIRVGYLPGSTSTSSMQLHPSSQLLAMAQQGGLMHVCRADELVVLAREQQREQQQRGRRPDELLLPGAMMMAMPRHGHHFHTDGKLSSARWDPRHSSLLAYCGVSRQAVQLYDAHAIKRLQLLLPPASLAGSSGSAGFSDCLLSSCAPYSVAAGGYSGQVHLWDSRASSTARLALNAARGSGICSLQASGDGHYIYGASGTGHSLFIWDVRKASASSSAVMHFGSAGPGQQALLQQLDLGPFLRAALADALLQLSSAAAPPQAPQQQGAALVGPMVLLPRHMVDMAPFSQILLDPHDPFRLAFVLRNSACGVVDLAARSVTRFCPMLPSATSTAPRQQACWHAASGQLLSSTAAPLAPAPAEGAEAADGADHPQQQQHEDDPSSSLPYRVAGVDLGQRRGNPYALHWQLHDSVRQQPQRQLWRCGAPEQRHGQDQQQQAQQQRGDFLTAGVSVRTARFLTALALHEQSQLLLGGSDCGSIAVLGVA